MRNKIRLGLLFGGKSIEHEVSLQSAKNVIHALDRSKYEVILIGIDKQGQWNYYHEDSVFLNADDPASICLGEKQGGINPLEFGRELDVAFPLIHGLLGEDGTVQGLLKLADVPFVGGDVLASSVGMDKDVMKRLLRDGGMPISRFIVVHQHQRELCVYQQVCDELGSTVFVKPANAGSSIGISKVADEAAFHRALDEAFQFDRKILIEEAIEGREIECSILGNERPVASLPCEIVAHGGFQSYISKYLDKDAATCTIPANLKQDEVARVQAAAIKAYSILCCEGFARLDMFLRPDGEILINEINTIPGLTNMSPYAKMWQASGMSMTQLIDELILLALDRHREMSQLKCRIDDNYAWT